MDGTKYAGLEDLSKSFKNSIHSLLGICLSAFACLFLYYTWFKDEEDSALDCYLNNFFGSS